MEEAVEMARGRARTLLKTAPYAVLGGGLGAEEALHLGRKKKLEERRKHLAAVMQEGSDAPKHLARLTGAHYQLSKAELAKAYPKRVALRGGLYGAMLLGPAGLRLQRNLTEAGRTIAELAHNK